MSDTHEQQQEKLAMAGAALTKLANERGLSINDFTEQETIDMLDMIMGGDDASAKVAGDAGSQPDPQVPTAPEATKVAYNVALGEVMKFAQAQGIDLNKVASDELHAATLQMQETLSNPELMQKQAEFEKQASYYDGMGRVMARAYVDELSKIAAATQAPADKEAAKVAFVRDLRTKLAGEMPPQFRRDGDDKGKGEDEDDKEKEKKAAAEFAKQANLRATEVLIESGINPQTGAKFASAQEQLDAAALFILQQKGYVG